MVIQTNEQEFKGKTLQEYLEWKYPTKEDKEGVRKLYFRYSLYILQCAKLMTTFIYLF